MSSRGSNHDVPNSEHEPTMNDMPPSAKLVAYVIVSDDQHSIAGITESSLLPRRTVRYALRRLEAAGLVDVRQSLGDARRRTFWLTNPETYR